MAMTGRFINHGVCVLAAVALLLAVMSSPIRPYLGSASAPPLNCLSRNFAILKFGHSGPFAMSAHSSLRKADSVQSAIEDELEADIEDELTVSSPPACVSFDVLRSPCPKPYSKLVSFAVSPTVRPLRC